MPLLPRLSKALGSKKEAAAKQPQKTPAPEESSSSLKRLFQEYRAHPEQPWNPEVTERLRELHDSLSTREIAEALLAQYDQDFLLDLRQQAADEHSALERIYMTRMQSFSELADSDLKSAVHESLLLFHVNPSDLPPLVLEQTVGYDEDGKPILDTSTFDVFPENAYSGIDGLERFLPPALKEGAAGFRAFARKHYPLLAAELDSTESAHIRALTTIGSLGGIGHKPDSDMDAQVIVETTPPVEQPWTDLDFFHALLTCLRRLLLTRMESALGKKFEQLREQAKLLLREKYHGGLTSEELRIIDSILPSTLQKLLDGQLWKLFLKRSATDREKLVEQNVVRFLQEHPGFERFRPALGVFFPFLNLPVQEISKTLKSGGLLQDFGTLIHNFQKEQALGIEARTEYPMLIKVRVVEQYLTKKYPNTEVHYFLNLLRNMREGRHTPFLVSPEGSLAYSLLLNDFLLNPAMMLAGNPPLPFCIPRELRPLLTVGVLPDSQWHVTQPDPQGRPQQVLIRTMADWGSMEVPRSLFIKHVIPIFLRESEKVSHRNLPKALLNCWWVELLCDEPYSAPLTSLTALVLNPKDREFVKHPPPEHPHLEDLGALEDAFPQLLLDPWWIKFSELLTRFPHKKVWKEIVFCFAQHLRLSDIINFSGQAESIWLDPRAAWRERAMVLFYQHFFPSLADRLELMHFAQGQDDMANLVEERLKKQFLDSMLRVERQLCLLGKQRAARQVQKYLVERGLRVGDNESIIEELELLVAPAHQRIAIEDRKVLVKLKHKEPLNALERLQAKVIYQDHMHLKESVEEIQARYAGQDLDFVSLEHCIHKWRVKVGGDANENVIFKYHFERNFKRKPNQIPLPISKSLCIPRALILISFNLKSGKWRFLSVLSRREAWTSGRTDSSNAMIMFEEPLVHGVARCVFSGYVGLKAPRITAWQKAAAKSSTKVSGNPFTQDDVQLLTQEIHDFFSPHQLRPRELLEHLHYVEDVMMVCNVNQFLNASLIVRDNLGDVFVADFDLESIPIDFSEKSYSDEDHRIQVFFLRLQTLEARQRFHHTLEMLEVPLHPDHPPRFCIWVNPKNFAMSMSPKYRGIYLNGIAQRLWPSEGEHVPWSKEAPPEPVESFDAIGHQAIDAFHEERETLRKKRDAHAARARMLARKYMDKIEREKAERERELME